jgi:hypothetical protein
MQVYQEKIYIQEQNARSKCRTSEGLYRLMFILFFFFYIEKGDKDARLTEKYSRMQDWMVKKYTN